MKNNTIAKIIGTGLASLLSYSAMAQEPDSIPQTPKDTIFLDDLTARERRAVLREQREKAAAIMSRYERTYPDTIEYFVEDEKYLHYAFPVSYELREDAVYVETVVLPIEINPRDVIIVDERRRKYPVSPPKSFISGDGYQ